ncbi:ribosome maturation factor RimM, partial [Nitrosomonadales bacterium]|nr:ribosome maturation factor RimM [Nitrosomonadales bacterium]
LEEIIVMAKISSPYGVKGWVKIFSFTEKLDTLLAYKKFFLSKDQKNWLEKEVKEIKLHGKSIIVKFLKIDNRSEAENLKDYLIGVSKDLLPKLNKDQYYWNELIGFEVLNLKNISFGNVDTFIETGANDVIVVRGDKERLIPYTSNTVLKVDTGGEKIIVDWDEEF